LYSLARNTTQSLVTTLKKETPDFYPKIEEIAKIMLSYEQRKKERHYLDYDDILDVVAQHIGGSEKIKKWVANQYDHLLVDEMQDTNPLQWKLIIQT
jgi:DNA helicase-2/ATP-dependent DNA helicase PcrA